MGDNSSGSELTIGLDKFIFVIFNALVVFSVIGGLSHFHRGSSTNIQRSWMMTWYVFGMIFGIGRIGPLEYWREPSCMQSMKSMI